MKLFIKAVNEEFKRLNARLDNLWSPSNSKSSKKQTFEEEEEEDSEHKELSSIKGKKVIYKRDNNLGSIKMKIPAFQGKNNLKLYLE